MLTLITVIWYVCGALFLLYVIVCAATLIVLEKKMNKKSKELLSACAELASFCENDVCIAENDINSISKAFEKICESNHGTAVTFEFYRQKEIVEKTAHEYNEAAQRYNELAKGFPACVVAQILGKGSVLMFGSE